MNTSIYLSSRFCRKHVRILPECVLTLLFQECKDSTGLGLVVIFSNCYSSDQLSAYSICCTGCSCACPNSILSISVS